MEGTGELYVVMLRGYTRGHVTWSSFFTLVLTCVRFIRLAYIQAAEFDYFMVFRIFLLQGAIVNRTYGEH